MTDKSDSASYLKKKSSLRQLLTVYGRKPVLEALQQFDLPCQRLHLADSNKKAGIIDELIQLAQRREIEIVYHDRQALSRISKNGKQDQGVCVDIHCPQHHELQDFIQQDKTHSWRLLALDRITNPQNLGMIIRSACAGQINGIVLPDKGCAKLDSLVIKASAGTVFKAPLLRCGQLEQGLQYCHQQGAIITGLSSYSDHSLAEFKEPNFVVYVLGNESEGLSPTIERLCDKRVFIPMNNQVESLNVAVAASLLAFRHCL